MILVYTTKITPRVRYIFKHIFTRILGINVDFTTKVEEFVAYNGMKMSYAKVPLGNEFFVKSHDLLFQQGVNHIDISISKWDNVPCFFFMGMKSSVPFDVFSASFYLITRYEEYLPHVKDEKGRFTVEQSLAYQNGFLEKPVVDIWAYKLLTLLKERFPDYVYKKRNYKFISTINVDKPFIYKNRGLFRGVGGFFNDLARLKLYKLADRIAVILNFKKDPYNTFDELIKLQKQYNIKTIFFFLIGEYNRFDANVSLLKRKFQLLIKDMVDYACVGLLPSYYTMDNIKLLKYEKERMEEVTHMPTLRSRQHFLRFELPKTYQNLIDLEIKEDYSMGYASHTGFRASTCTPFYFYDIGFEIQTPLKVYPFALMDTTLKNHMKLTPKQSLGKIKDLKKQVKGVNGTFVTIFHNKSVSGYTDTWSGWGNVYDAMLKIATEKE
ncbi:MAG: hypothetical protein CR961_00895 [Polaribacter sp.]|nr:MAG: hypothetical protein CR961_00895 [Polaribacter sp.]